MPRSAIHNDLDKAIEAIRHFYRIGLDSRAKNPGRCPPDVLVNEAQRHGLHPAIMTKARTFAAAYTPAQVERLCKACWRTGFPLSVTHITRLVTVPKDHRQELERQAVQAHWGCRQLEVEIVRRLGKRATGGRRHRVPADAVDAYYELDRFCDSWLRLSAALTPQPPVVEEGFYWPPPPPPELHPGVTGQRKKADAAVTKLQALVRAQLQATAKRHTKPA